MQRHRFTLLAVCAFCAFFAAVSIQAETPTPDQLETYVTLLIAKPADGAAPPQGVLVTPGMVIPMPAESAEVRLEKEQQAGQELHRVADRLAKTFRLKDVEVRYRVPLRLDLDLGHDLPAPAESSPVRLRIKLLGFNGDSASYQVELREGPSVIADTEINVLRGERAVVGGLDGEDAPYLFLVVEPEVSEQAIPMDGNDPTMTPPRAIDKPAPSFTEEARKARLEGVVVTQVEISKTGTVDDVKVLKGLDHGLTESAVEALKTWRFEPALKDGKPIAVLYYLTINFRLDKEEEK